VANFCRPHRTIPIPRGKSKPVRLHTQIARYQWAISVALILILLLATFLRVWRLDSVPRGPSHDEAYNGLMAGEVLKGYRPVFFEINMGVEPALIYAEALAFWLFGESVTVQRLVSVAFGLLTVLLTYVLAAHLFKSRLVGLLSTLLIAISFWHVFVSRLALRAVVMPPLQILTLFFFWRGLEEHRLRHFVLAGLFGGLTMYSYLSSRFLPFIPIIFVLYLLLRSGISRGVWWRLGVMIAIWLLVFLPLGVFYLNNPQWFLLRAEQALVISRPHSESGLPAVLRQTLATLGMFSFEGDPSWRYNLAGRPVFDWAMALAFYGGIVLSLVHSVRKPRLNPYAFILIIQAVMLVPDFITDVSPHFLRTIGAAPTTVIFPAIAVVALYRRLRPGALALGPGRSDGGLDRVLRVVNGARLLWDMGRQCEGTGGLYCFLCGDRRVPAGAAEGRQCTDRLNQPRSGSCRI